MVYTPWGTTVIVRGAGIRWPGETGTPTAGLLLDRYSPQVNAGALPAETVQAHASRQRAGVAAHPTGRLRLVTEESGDLVLMDSAPSGRGGNDVTTLSGHTDPALVTDPHTQIGWLVARRTSDGHCVLYAVARPNAGAAPDLELRADLGPCDAGASGVTVQPDGSLLVARVSAGTIHVHRSRDAGRTFAQLA